MFNNEKKGFFDAFKPKTAFIIGLITGLLVLCTVGFFIFLSKEIKGGGLTVKTNNQPTANVNTGNNIVQPNTNAGQPINIAVTASDHILGNKNAPIKLIEYSDFECPFCIRAFPTVDQILKTYKNDVLFYYMHFPLTQIHPNAQKAAEASLCAADQGKFWEFHDKLFTLETAQ